MSQSVSVDEMSRINLVSVVRFEGKSKVNYRALVFLPPTNHLHALPPPPPPPPSLPLSVSSYALCSHAPQKCTCTYFYLETNQNVTAWCVLCSWTRVNWTLVWLSEDGERKNRKEIGISWHCSRLWHRFVLRLSCQFQLTEVTLLKFA